MRPPILADLLAAAGYVAARASDAGEARALAETLVDLAGRGRVARRLSGRTDRRFGDGGLASLICALSAEPTARRIDPVFLRALAAVSDAAASARTDDA